MKIHIFGISKNIYTRKLKKRKAHVTFYVLKNLFRCAYKLQAIMVQMDASVFQEIYFFGTLVLFKKPRRYKKTCKNE